MKKERDTLNRELVVDKANQAKIESRIQAKFENMEKMGSMVSFLEEKLEAYETLINESEEAYNKVGSDLNQITENAGRLVTVLHEQCDKIEGKVLTAKSPSINV